MATANSRRIAKQAITGDARGEEDGEEEEEEGEEAEGEEDDEI